MAAAVAQEIKALKFTRRKDICLAVTVENELRDPALRLLESPMLIDFKLHKLSWCAPACSDNPKAGEFPDLICSKMPRGITIRLGAVSWSTKSAAAVLVETDDNSLNKADFGLILRKGNYKIVGRGDEWKVVRYENQQPSLPKTR